MPMLSKDRNGERNVTLELTGVSHAYVGVRGARLALEGLNLAVGTGEFVSLVGPSGCGKTTVLSLLAGLFPPSRGRVLLSGQPVRGPSARIGYMLQQDYLFPWRTIRDNVLIGFDIAGNRNAGASEAADALLAELGLPDAGGRYPHELSGGMRQRAALARTLIAGPDVLLLDEPFSALDMTIKLQLEDLVWETLRKLGKTAVLVTHDLAEAAAMSERVVVLVADPGTIADVVDVPAELRRLKPTEARKAQGFNALFDRLWKRIGRDGGGAEEGGGVGDGEVPQE
ncbi:spermidine/putrescine ABC transporter ATP-binding protein [Paenibacillus darwinianus]|uniref:Spermidine/putrescine ABC transporter ATP-binding protein n=1 Tax=Paenibacillus darwinianus TaxID=1380763 RepID=A0A9W5S1M0_9BACL|nr:ABC transporter ATP-binding protein [Paenibacillus darwinianus]EXX89778.1 spermidine/putrescine ABC transporter ATP-binding protein [Paenibacillus darwinianus]EXX90142.1 spermidine/putrescine ABC transporter ATP-binding protein [Paenibacillus darwinianus]EXX90508.1 spermidine/putrescine ABC transporter ATP-binding protein [Paenibacillus darwinianus]